MPTYNVHGEVLRFDVSVTANRPQLDKGGPVAKVTFRLPKRLFGPAAEMLVVLEEDMLDATPQVLAADLKAMRDKL